MLAAGRRREDSEAETRRQLADGVPGLDIYRMRPGLEDGGLVYLDSLDDLEQDR